MIPRSEESRLALNELRAWATLHDADHSVWQAIVTLQDAVNMARKLEADAANP